jgi:hypothetical protein
MARRKMGAGFIVLIVLLVIVLAIGGFLLYWYRGASYPVFDSISKAAFEIPGLDDSISPQGLCTLPDNDSGYNFAMSGYIAKTTTKTGIYTVGDMSYNTTYEGYDYPENEEATGREPSRIYFINQGTGATKYILVLNNGLLETSHFGGITCTGNYLYVTSGSRLLRISLADALAAKSGDTVQAVDSVYVGLSAAFCYTDGTYLYAGEFYRAGNYETDETHHLSVANEETNYAFVYQFELDESAAGGVKSETPTKAISIRGKVQGIAVYEDGIILSASYGLSDSVLYCYRNILNDETDRTTSANGEVIPLYILDANNLRGEMVAPSMSEEICIKDGNLYVLFESKCVKYTVFTRRSESYVRTFALSDWTF